jgi:hypothetical protein
MRRTIRVSRNLRGVSVNDKHISGSGYFAPAGLLDFEERKALALFVTKKEKIQSSIFTL